MKNLNSASAIEHVELDPTQHGFAHWLADQFFAEVERLMGERRPNHTLLTAKVGKAGELFIGCAVKPKGYEHHAGDWL